MSLENNYIEINKNSWNNRVDVHVQSEFYDVAGFLQGASSLNPIELELLGDIKGKSILHLQCHFGQDTLSLARMGAQVTGVDLSDKAIHAANTLAKQADLAAEFICCNIYDLPQYLDQQFDIVFTSYGTITWLPDLDQWAKLIHRYLKPEGKFIMAEFHPFVWSFDDAFEQIAYNYFNESPIVETESGTYADKSADIQQSYVSWNHSLSEVLQSLLDNNLSIKNFQEYDYSPYDIFKDSVEIAPKQFRVKKMGNRLPLVYSIVAQKIL